MLRSTGVRRQLVYSSDPSKLASTQRTLIPGGQTGQVTYERSSSTEGRAIEIPAGRSATSGQMVSRSAPNDPKTVLMNTASEVTTLPTGETAYSGVYRPQGNKSPHQQTAPRPAVGRSPSPNTVGGKRSKGLSSAGGQAAPNTDPGNIPGTVSAAPSRRHRFFGNIGNVFSKTFVK